MSEFEELHAKYARGDSLSDDELRRLSDMVGDLAEKIRPAERILGSASVHYVNLLESHLAQLTRARARIAAEEAMQAGPGMR
jgi:hypothetical protein